jgi:hypothetical protein
LEYEADKYEKQPEARSDRALSEEPASSYDEDADMNREEEEEEGMRPLSNTRSAWIGY